MADDPFCENAAQNWRQITDELDEIHVRSLEEMERHGASQETLLDKARVFSSQKMLGEAFHSIVPPSGAGQWADWQGDTDDGTLWVREFFCAEDDFSGLRIRVQGHQRSDGSVGDAELLASGHGQLNSEQCRQLAAALFAHAEKIDDLIEGKD
jgi:hypothetical protein